MANQNDVIETTILIGGTPVGRAGFGTAIVVDDASMTERIRFYTTPGAVTADRLAGAITQAQAEHLTIALTQARKPARVAAARADFTLTAQVTTVTVGGTPAAGAYTIIINGTPFTFSATTETNDAIATELRALINAGTQPVTASGATAAVVVTSDFAGTPFSATTSTPVGATLVVVVTTASGNTLNAELDAILGESAQWYGLHMIARDAASILAAAAWAETNAKLHIAQSSDASIIAAGAGDVASILSAQSRAYSKVYYSAVDAAPVAFGALTQQLTSDPDIEPVPPIGLIQISGVTAQDSVISETQRTISRTKRVGLYLTLKGVAATDSSPGATQMADGRFVDARIVVDWLRERTNENVASFLLTQRALGRRVPYTDKGFQQIGAIVEALLELGITNGNLESAIDPLTDDVISPRVFLPLRATLPQAEVEQRRITFQFQALLAGAVALARLRGVLTDDLDLLAQLAP